MNINKKTYTTIYRTCEDVNQKALHKKILY